MDRIAADGHDLSNKCLLISEPVIPACKPKCFSCFEERRLIYFVLSVNRTTLLYVINFTSNVYLAPLILKGWVYSLTRQT